VTEPASGPISIAVHSGDFERVHYALVMASAAAASDRAATLFFTGRAVAAVTGATGWHTLAAPPDGAAAHDGRLRAKGVAGFDELMSACGELGVRFIVCEMALRAAAVASDALRRDVKLEIAGVVTFLNQAGTGAVIFV
jgi:peroxiredoxin family protein